MVTDRTDMVQKVQLEGRIVAAPLAVAAGKGKQSRFATTVVDRTFVTVVAIIEDLHSLLMTPLSMAAESLPWEVA